MKSTGCFFLLTLSTVITALGGPLKESYVLRERGITREFVVATDEIHMARQAKRIPAVPNPDEARVAAGKANAAAELILYPKGEPRNDANRRFLTKRLAVQLAPGADPARVAAAGGVKIVAPGHGARGWVLVEAPGEPGSALEAAERLLSVRGVLAVEPQLARQQQKRFVPGDTLFREQWHLQNTGQREGVPGIDIRVTGVWDNFRGDGVTLAIVDDGLQHSHPDLLPNYEAADSFDFNFNDPDPQPEPFDGNAHGTSCAGVAAARGNNLAGGCGAAFNARVAGLRLIAAPATDEEEAAAFAFHNETIDIKSNSWGPADDGRTLAGAGPLTLAAIQEAAANGRGGRGSIIVWAGGNGREGKDDANFDGYANLREAIAIGALTNTGEQAFYSETGANLVVVAPSDGGTLGITTTDLVGEDGYNWDGDGDFADLDYTDDFGGTSSAAPLAAGVVALLLQARPELGWRDVQEILMRSARKVEPSDVGWFDNADGFHFNAKFGAGLIDAQAAIELAQTWTNLGPILTSAREAVLPDAKIPDNRSAGLEHAFVFSGANLRVEHAVLTVDIRHKARGELEIELTSPAGTKSVLAPERPRDRGDDVENWSFLTRHFWGEQGDGEWTARLIDGRNRTVGTVSRLKLELFGATSVRPIVANGATLTGDPNRNGFYETGEVVTVSLSLKNVSDTPTENLVATLLRTGGVDAPSGPQNYGVIQPGESKAREFSFTVAAETGSDVVAKLRLQDGANIPGEAVFVLPVGRLGTATVSAELTEAVDLPKRGTRGIAGLYPSTIDVSALPPGAVIRKVKATVALAHDRSEDLDLLLAKGDAGPRVLLMSDAGSGPFEASVTFDDGAAAEIPEDAAIVSGTYRPSNFDRPRDRFSKPAPQQPFGPALAAFKGLPASDLWQLFIRDDKKGRTGVLSDWSLEISYAY